MISYQPSVKRHREDIEALMQKGGLNGFGQAVHARVFYQDGCGNYEAKKTSTANCSLACRRRTLSGSLRLLWRWAKADHVNK